jgi:hypothetical protein
MKQEKVSLVRIIWDAISGAGKATEEVATVAVNAAKAASKEVAKALIAYNPINANRGDIVFVRLPDFEKNRFVIDAINVTECKKGKETLVFADYHLVDQNDSAEEGGKWRVLRVVPRSGKPSDQDRTTFLLTKDLDCAYDQGAYDSLNSGELPVERFAEHGFARNGNRKKPYTATVTEHKADGKELSEIEYWDFTATTNDGMLLLYVVEMTTEGENRGWFEGYTGPVIDEKSIETVR